MHTAHSTSSWCDEADMLPPRRVTASSSSDAEVLSVSQACVGAAGDGRELLFSILIAAPPRRLDGVQSFEKANMVVWLLCKYYYGCCCSVKAWLWGDKSVVAWCCVGDAMMLDGVANFLGPTFCNSPLQTCQKSENSSHHLLHHGLFSNGGGKIEFDLSSLFHTHDTSNITSTTQHVLNHTLASFCKVCVCSVTR